MKKLNKGFAISGIIYSILILFLLFIFSILAILGSRKLIIDKFKLDEQNKINNNELEKENIISNDVNIAFEYVGNKSKPDKFPGKGEGYYVQSVSCQNGTAKWSNELWALTDIETENIQIMSCELTLGDNETYDNTIDQSFENLKPENVASGVQIGDVTGEASGSKKITIFGGSNPYGYGVYGYTNVDIVSGSSTVAAGTWFKAGEGSYSFVAPSSGRVVGQQVGGMTFNISAQTFNKGNIVTITYNFQSWPQNQGNVGGGCLIVIEWD